MTKVMVLGGDFAKTDAKFGKEEIAFHRKNNEADLEIVPRDDIASTYYATEDAIRRPDVPEQLRADFKEARRTLPDPAGSEVVVTFKDKRWAYVRAANQREARKIHTPDNACDRAAPPAHDDDSEDRDG